MLNRQLQGKFGRNPPKNAPALMLASFLTGVVPAHPASDRLSQPVEELADAGQRSIRGLCRGDMGEHAAAGYGYADNRKLSNDESGHRVIQDSKSKFSHARSGDGYSNLP